jgi:pyruvate dehydrogenase E2 component (dihydrolipoamide acetyltransferase)
MRVEVAMPRLSDAMTEGKVTAWFKNEGDEVTEGEAIGELETEKSTVDLQAPAAGRLARIVVAAGTDHVAVGTVLAEIETDAQAAAASPAKAEPEAPAAKTRSAQRDAKSKTKDTESASAGSADKRVETKAGENAQATERAASTTPVHVPAASPAEEKIAATPLARRMAAQAGVPLATLKATGIGGKICKADVEAALGKKPSLSVVSSRAASSVLASRGAAASAPRLAEVAKGESAPLSRVRRTIAERMTRAKATIPHFYLSVDCRVDRLLEVRGRLKDDGLSISVNDFVVRATALALVRVPGANASWTDDGNIVRHDRIDIAVAVALDEGLVTPVLRAVDTLGLGAIGEQVRELAARARDGKLSPNEYDGATFTISNLGMHGVGEMFAIINPPQACILGVGATEARPVVENGQVVAGTVMTLSISADHRVLDGTTGAQLLAEIRRLLEEPARMLI